MLCIKLRKDHFAILILIVILIVIEDLGSLGFNDQCCDAIGNSSKIAENILGIWVFHTPNMSHKGVLPWNICTIPNMTLVDNMSSIKVYPHQINSVPWFVFKSDIRINRWYFRRAPVLNVQRIVGLNFIHTRIFLDLTKAVNKPLVHDEGRYTAIVIWQLAWKNLIPVVLIVESFARPSLPSV